MFPPGPVQKCQWMPGCLRVIWRSQASRLTRPTSPPPARSPPPALQVERSLMTEQLPASKCLSLSCNSSLMYLKFSSDCCGVFLDTSSAPPKPSRPGPSRQLQRWPESGGGRMKRGGNVFESAHKSQMFIELLLVIWAKQVQQFTAHFLLDTTKW